LEFCGSLHDLTEGALASCHGDTLMIIIWLSTGNHLNSN